MCGDFGVGGGGWGGGPGTCLPSFQITNFFIFLFQDALFLLDTLISGI